MYKTETNGGDGQGRIIRFRDELSSPEFIDIENNKSNRRVNMTFRNPFPRIKYKEIKRKLMSVHGKCNVHNCL